MSPDPSLFLTGITPYVLNNPRTGEVLTRLYFPDATESIGTFTGDVAFGLGGAAAHDLSKWITSRNFATIVDDFGRASYGLNPSIGATAAAEFSEFARSASKLAGPVAFAAVLGAAGLNIVGGDIDDAAKGIASFAIGARAAALGEVMASGYASALTAGYYGPVSAEALAFWSGRFPYDARLYRERNIVERFFCRLKDMRRIAQRFDKHADNFLSAVYLFSIRLWVSY